jgi:hypothetical protein
MLRTSDENQNELTALGSGERVDWLRLYENCNVVAVTNRENISK